MNQIRHHSTEFTAYDFFTLNTQIIKSVSVDQLLIYINTIVLGNLRDIREKIFLQQ